jgi:gamma-glutamyl:cysteine ligase YbdK (ATP-grasp superfamily)
MGTEISSTSFSASDFVLFHQKLMEETKIIMEWFRSNRFDHSDYRCGIELEAWLLDGNCNPAAENSAFLKATAHPLVFPELSKFNFELNTLPLNLHGRFISIINDELTDLWKLCTSKASSIGCRVLTAGILPTLSDTMLNISNISSSLRYSALNREILKSRREKPLKIHIEGERDRLSIEHCDVMAEAATTSLQLHLQVSPEMAARACNLAMILSAPSVALAANSPFLFEKDLWEETRIPLFEQAVWAPAFTDRNGRIVSRVTFDTGYARRSLLEAFLDNLDGFPVILPVISEEKPEKLFHALLHNGTIWRWNRPLIGWGENGKPHLRIEHRVQAAGPSIADMTANAAWYYGAMLHFLSEPPGIELELPFEESRSNFYNAARYGIDTEVTWRNGQRKKLGELIAEVLLPGAAAALDRAGVDKGDIEYYLNGILKERISTGRTGAAWQKNFIRKHGRDFRRMTEQYYLNQQQQKPVNEWIWE